MDDESGWEPVHARQGTVPVDGAEIYYERLGEGAPALIIQGGLGEAGATGQLAEALAVHYQVISYDRRGLSRSPVSPEAPSITMDGHADDARALLTALSTQPACVVGASIGALIGLHLAVRHPEQVTTLVAHEPPMAALLLDPEREAMLDEIAILASRDVRAAIQRMGALTGGSAATEAGARPEQRVGDLEADLRQFFAQDFPAVRGSTLGAESIEAVPESTTVIPTGGMDSRGQWEYRCAERLARELHRPLVQMPGGHNGLISHPWATAAALVQLFAGVDIP